MKDVIKAFLVIMAFSVVLVLCIRTPPPKPLHNPKFSKYQIVQMKLDKKQGMVIDSYDVGHPVEWFYVVRFANNLQINTNTHLLSNDGPLTITQPYISVHVNENELEEVSKDKN